MAEDFIDVIMDEMAGWANKATPPPEGNEMEARRQLELLRDYVGVSELGELSEWGLRNLLLSVYPRKVTVLDKGGLVDVLPATRDLVRFAEDTGRVPADTAAGLRSEIEKIEPELESTVMDPANWGMARSIMHQVAADGLDPTNPEELDRWINEYNSASNAAPPADRPEGMHELASALGLPEQFPPLRLGPEDELADAARASGLLTRAAELAVWTGEMRETEDGELSAQDTVSAAEAVGITLPGATEPDGAIPGMPARPPVKAMRDVPELRSLWYLAESARLLEICEGHVHVDADPADLSDDDALGAWTGAFGYVLSGWLPTDAQTHRASVLDMAAVGIFAFAALSLAREPVAVSEIAKDVEEIVVHTTKERKAWKSWTARHGDPTSTLLTRLAELGAVTVRDGAAELTPLGWYGAREVLIELDVDVPVLPPRDEMTATDLVDAAVAGVSENEIEPEIAAWLDTRDPAAAAEELLAVAVAGPAAPRIVATSIATTIGDAAEPQWRAALDRIELRPYAKIALAKIVGDAAGEVMPGAEPEPSDAAWLLADTVMATADEDDDAVLEQFRQAVPAGHEPDMFDALWRLPHPDAPEVLGTLGRVHPDKKIAKLARKAAFKARSQSARAQP